MDMDLGQLTKVVRKASLELPNYEDRESALDFYMTLVGSSTIYVPDQGKSISVPQVVMAEMIRLWTDGRKIWAIKLLRDTTGLGLKDAKEAVEHHMENAPG